MVLAWPARPFYQPVNIISRSRRHYRLAVIRQGFLIRVVPFLQIPVQLPFLVAPTLLFLPMAVALARILVSLQMVTCLGSRSTLSTDWRGFAGTTAIGTEMQQPIRQPEPMV